MINSYWFVYYGDRGYAIAHKGNEASRPDKNSGVREMPPLGLITFP